MKNDKLFNNMIVIALIIDLTVFGFLIYKNMKLESRVKLLEDEIFRLATKLEEQGRNIPEIDATYVNDNKNNGLKEALSQDKQDFNNAYDEAADNLDENIFLIDVKNYSTDNKEIKITKTQAKSIAQKGFEESKSRIAGEGADNEESEIIELKEISPNNYFTRHFYEYSEIYTEIKRQAYVVTRENEMGNGISIYVDATTGLIIGGEAFGD